MKPLLEILRTLAAALAKAFRRRKPHGVAESAEAPAQPAGLPGREEDGSTPGSLGSREGQAEREVDAEEAWNAADVGVPGADGDEAPGPGADVPAPDHLHPADEIERAPSDAMDDEERVSTMPLPVVAGEDHGDGGAPSMETVRAESEDAALCPPAPEPVVEIASDVALPVESETPATLGAGGAEAETAIPVEVPVAIIDEEEQSQEATSSTPSAIVGTNGQRGDVVPPEAASATGAAPESESPEVDDDNVEAPDEESGATEPVLLDGPVADAAAAASKRVRTPARPSKRTPRQYRPVVRGPSVARPSSVSGTNAERRERALRIDLRAQMEHGFWRISLLPRRDAALPQEVAINQDGVGSLIGLQDEWYQDIEPAGVGALLTRGIEWQTRLEDGSVARWSLSGRELFVLAKHEQLAGFVAIPRLVVGERHVVLCTESRTADVRRAIAATGAAAPVEFDAGLGAPPGWIGLHGVVPRHPVPPSAEGDILDALCPQPEVEIALEGGIRLERSTWLAGFPPLIRLRGDASRAGEVSIDGKVAAVSGEGVYVADDWDRLGDHQVWSAGKSLTYAIADGSEAWEPWEAYRWSLGELATPDIPARPAVCGALVLPPAEKRSRKEGERTPRRAMVVAASNPLLLGRVPGQFYASPVRSDLQARTSTAFPPFEPVWAVPADPLHCDKRSARIVLIGRAERASGEFSGGAREIAQWCEAILGASRKGLQTEPERPEVTTLWKEYKDVARALRRRRRR